MVIVSWIDKEEAASSPDDSELVRTGGTNAEADGLILVVTGGSVVSPVATVSSLLPLLFGRTVGPPMRVEVRYRPNSLDILVRSHSVSSHCYLKLSMSPANISSEFDI
jgi:hypothetical protein